MNGARRVTRVTDLFAYLVSNPHGVTIDQAAAHLGVSRGEASIDMRLLRDVLGDHDKINVVCNPNPADPSGRWLYELVGTMEGSQEWVSNRIADTTRRIQTMQAVMSSAVRATDGRTKNGKKARVFKKSFGRLLEDIRDIEQDVTP